MWAQSVRFGAHGALCRLASPRGGHVRSHGGSCEVSDKPPACNTRPLLCAGTTSPGGSRQRALDGAFSPSPATPRPRHAARTACCDRRESRRRSRVCRATRGSSPVRTLGRAAGLRRARRLSRGLELLSPLTTRLGAQSPALAAAPPGRRWLRVGGGVLVRVEPRSARAHCRPPPSPASTLPPGPPLPIAGAGFLSHSLACPFPCPSQTPRGFLSRTRAVLSVRTGLRASVVGGWVVSPQTTLEKTSPAVPASIGVRGSPPWAPQP